MALIDLQKISKTYKLDTVEVPALVDADLRIESGEFVAIMGPSGSGKSTLMNLIGLLDRATSGTYKLNGQPVSLTMSDGQLAKLRAEFIGFIFQNFNLLSSVDVLSNVMLPSTYLSGKTSQSPKARAEQLLRDVGLEHRMKYKPNRLSGGERQRVAIARALMNEPKVILADEPTGNLDSKSGEEVIKVLEGLNHQGTTLLMVTHNDELAARANRIVKLKDGRIVS